MIFPFYYTINVLYNRLIWKLDNLLGTTFSKPAYISLRVTKRCNSSCKMCPYPHLHLKPPYIKSRKDMSTNQIKNLIIDLKKWLGPFMLTFTGGEPTLRKDIWELIAFANNLKIRTILCTNGTLITKKNILLLINSGLNDMWISLDSLNPKTYKKTRGKDFTKKVLQTINLLKGHTKNINVYINTVITKHNINELPELIEFVKQKKLNSITLSPMASVMYSDVKNRFHNLWPDQKKVETIINQIIEYKKKGYPLSNPIRHLELIKQYYKNPNSIDEKCQASQSLFIRPTSHVSTCLKQLESATNKSPKEIWNSKEYKQLRKKMSKCKKSCAITPCVNYTYNSLINKLKYFRQSGFQ